MVNMLGMKLNKREISRAFKIVDIADKGHVKFMDFVSTYINKIAPGTLSWEKVESVYKECDKNCKSFLSVEEFRECMRRLGNDSSSEKIDKLMNSACKNSAGKLRFCDFCDFLGLKKE